MLLYSGYNQAAQSNHSVRHAYALMPRPRDCKQLMVEFWRISRARGLVVIDSGLFSALNLVLNPILSAPSRLLIGGPSSRPYWTMKGLSSTGTIFRRLRGTLVALRKRVPRGLLGQVRQLWFVFHIGCLKCSAEDWCPHLVWMRILSRAWLSRPKRFRFLISDSLQNWSSSAVSGVNRPFPPTGAKES